MDTQNGDTNAFARKEKLCRSPLLKDVVAQMFSGISQQQTTPTGQGSGPNLITFTPMSKDDSQQPNKLQTVKGKLLKLIDYMKERMNVHAEIKKQAAQILTAVLAAEVEQEALIKRAVTAEEALAASLESAATLAQGTPRATRREKRDRESPGDTEDSKKRKDGQDGDDGELSESRADEQCDREKGEANGWRTIPKQKEKKEKKKKMKEEKQKRRRNLAETEVVRKIAAKKDRPHPRRIRSKGDALIVGVKDGMTYADLLKKMRGDPKLKELGDNVVKTRRTQRGEMLFELKKDPEIKSAAFKELVETALGSEAEVRAMSQETTVEAKNLDEVTTESEVKAVLTRAEYLGDVPMSIRLRKAYGSTQAASIRLPIAAANQLLKIDRVKIGWAVVSFRAIPREPKEMERCFRCMDFGHQARNCPGPDRSKLCRKCGKEGHIAKDCKKQPRCMLCKEKDGNAHMTGGFKCPVYIKAKACLQ